MTPASPLAPRQLPASLPPRPRVGVIGAGALGGFYGARLARAGQSDVHLLIRRPEDRAAIASRGLRVKSYEGDFVVQPAGVHPDAATLGPCDLLIIGLKATDNAALTALLAPTFQPGRTLILTLQNGLGNEEAIASSLPAGSSTPPPPAAPLLPILGGIAFICSNRTGPGEIHHIDQGWLRLAEWQGPATPRLHQVAGLFRYSGLRCDADDDLLYSRWTKLCWNIPFNGLGAAGLHDVATILADPALARVAAELMQEVLAIARAADNVDLPADLPDRMMANSRTMGPYKTSMQLDAEAYRPLEVEAILGEPLRRARQAGVVAPRLHQTYEAARARS